MTMNVLLVRPDGIGDEILCLPVASALRRLMPEAKISFLSSAYAAPVLAQHPDLASVLSLSGTERFSDVVALFRRGFDVAIFLKPFRSLMAAAFVARVPVRVATGYRWYSLLANRRVYEHRSDFTRHEAAYNLGLLRGVGLEPGEPIRPQLFLTDDERQGAAARLKALPSPCIVVHPGGFSSRQWKLHHYRDLMQRLIKEGYGVVLSGSQAEQDRFRAETGWTGPGKESILDVMGAVTLRQLMAIIGESQVLVSGSTGPAHIAAGLGVRTVSLFDPRRNQSPTRWQPLGQGIVLRPDVPTCEKCIYEACPYWDCLDRISVEDVVSRVRQVTAGSAEMAVVHV
ncbi:MAG: glycosyltransferase family 9 protein [Nitrospirota bacterium]|nr:glycosyltransferase family 9 protein [Nitrospirota bacterium]